MKLLSSLAIVGLCLAPAAANADLPLYNYKATTLRVVDGDTLYCDIDAGFGITLRNQRIRLLSSHGGVNAYEMHDKDPAKRDLAAKGKRRMEGLLPVGEVFFVHTEKADEFGRYLGRIVLKDGTDVGDLLLTEGLATEWRK